MIDSKIDVFSSQLSALLTRVSLFYRVGGGLRSSFYRMDEVRDLSFSVID